MSWAGSDQLMTVWLDQTQTVATYLLCDVSTATCEQVGLFMAAHHCIIPLPFIFFSFYCFSHYNDKNLLKSMRLKNNKGANQIVRN